MLDKKQILSQKEALEKIRHMYAEIVKAIEEGRPYICHVIIEPSDNPDIFTMMCTGNKNHENMELAFLELSATALGYRETKE